MKTKMSQYINIKIKLLSFVSILLVIYVHMYFADAQEMTGLQLMEDFWSRSVGSVAVPLFYVISGYLFFIKSDGVKAILHKISKRVRTLLVPYLLMNTFAFLFSASLNVMASKIPALAPFINFRVFREISQQGWVQSLLTFYWTDPIAFQLWFVRDLMVIILFSPLIYYLLRYVTKGRLGLLMFTAIEACLLAAAVKSGQYFGSAFWFMAGGYISKHPRISVTRCVGKPPIAVVSLIVFIALAWCNVFYPLELFQWILPVVGITSLWSGYDVLFQHRHNLLASLPWLAAMCSTVFFVYLVHEPLLNIFKKLPTVFNWGETPRIIIYLVLPPLFYYIASLAGNRLKHSFPRAYSVFTGGR